MTDGEREILRELNEDCMSVLEDGDECECERALIEGGQCPVCVAELDAMARAEGWQ